MDLSLSYRHSLRALLIAITASTSATLLAQEFYITQDSISTCQGAFLDSGGNPSEYADNESFTSTICPDGGPAISLQWVLFNLSTAGTSPLDQISIYDGPTIDAPLIGTWVGGDSPGIISASFANTSGCLTVVFTSNSSGTGNFAANITCFQPCEPPTANAIVVGETIPVLLCQDEVLSFDASASTAAAGFAVDQYIWDFADGTQDSTSGATVQHSFTEPAEYVVQVTVVDDNGCESVNLVDLQVLVSTTPDFSATSFVQDTTVCQGALVQLDANGVEAVNWSALPESTLGDGIFLPDLQGVPFNTTMTFSNFTPGGTLVDPDDLESICVSMEHSYMGDLVISITCPNGQSIDFHQQGGGGTYIGVPVDDESDVPGECWEYCWSPIATNGTWEDNSGNGTLAAGTYESVEPFSDLVGCPLNGVWTLTVNDLFAIDNGYICDWSINFDPSLFPSLTSYTPELGITSSDSASWSGPNLTPDPNDPLSATASATTAGSFDYTFSVIDNFGCSYDTTITITIEPSPQGPITITGDPMICEDGIAYLDAPPGYDSYVWSPNGAVGQNVNFTAGTYTVTVGLGNCTLESAPFVVVAVPDPQPVITGLNFSCGGEPSVLSTTESYASYQWSNGSQSPSVSVPTGSYTVTVSNAEGCTGQSDPYAVDVANDPVASFVTVPNPPQPMGSTIQFDDNSTIVDGTITGWDWTFDAAGNGSSEQSPSWTYPLPGNHLVTLIVTSSDGCTDTLSMTYVIYPPEITIPNVMSPNGDNANDVFEITNIIYWSNELKIYSRWGDVVYETQNYKNTWKGDGVPDGTYYYLLTLGDGREWAGHLTLLR